MQSKIPVESKKMVRDLKSRAVLSVDIDALKAYKEKVARNQQAKSAVEKIEQLEKEVRAFREQFDKLKEMQAILEKYQKAFDAINTTKNNNT